MHFRKVVGEHKVFQSVWVSKALHSFWHIVNLRNVWSMMQHQLLSLSFKLLSSEKSPPFSNYHQGNTSTTLFMCMSVLKKCFKGLVNCCCYCNMHSLWDSFVRCLFKVTQIVSHSTFPNPKCGIDKIHICFGNLCLDSVLRLQLGTVMHNIQLSFVHSFFVVIWISGLSKMLFSKFSKTRSCNCAVELILFPVGFICFCSL